MKRFWDKVNVLGPDDCWLWTGSLARGYGAFRFGGRQCVATRVSWELRHGVEVPKGLEVCHSCDDRYPPGDYTSRKCVNPEHLWIGTRDQNMADMVAKGRSPLGSRNAASKATPELVRAIRSLREERGLSQRDIGEQVGLSRETVRNILNGTVWSHIH